MKRRLSVTNLSSENNLPTFCLHRVVTLAADKLKKQWLCIIDLADCIRQLERKLSRPSNNQDLAVNILCIFKVACLPVFLRSTNLKSKLIEFFVFVKF